MEIIDYKKIDQNTLEFNINGINSSMANALRRTMISEVPTMAIEYVSIYKNNGVLTDEVLSHRLGMLPIRVLDPTITSATFRLNISYDPERADDNNLQTVYSKDLVTDDPVKMVYDDIIVTKLAPDHVLEIVADTTINNGKEHSKWSPCSGTSFDETDVGYKFHIETTGSLTPDEVFKTSIEILKTKLYS